MIKKIGMGLGMLALGSYLWMGTGLGSYARTGYTQVKGYVAGQVPIEFELKRAKQLLGELTPTIQKTFKSVIAEKFHIGRLQAEIERADQNLKQEQVAIMALRDHLAKGLTSYTIGSDNYSAGEMRAELNRRFNSFRRVDRSLQAKRQSLATQKAALLAAQDKYDGLVESKERLENEVAELEARHKMIEAQKVANRFEIDDSCLSEVRQVIDKLDEQLAIEAELTQQEGNLVKRIPVENLPPSDLVEQVDQYFGDDVSVDGAASL